MCWSLFPPLKPMECPFSFFLDRAFFAKAKTLSAYATTTSGEAGHSNAGTPSAAPHALCALSHTCWKFSRAASSASEPAGHRIYSRPSGPRARLSPAGRAAALVRHRAPWHVEAC